MEKKIYPLFNETVPINDYLLLISFTNPAAREVHGLKRALYYQIGDFESRNSKAHITLMNFKSSCGVENKIVKTLRKVAAAFKPFPVKLKNFGKFDSAETIFLNVDNTEPIIALNRALLAEIKPLTVKTGFKFGAYPYVTIGRNLKGWRFPFAWKMFQHQPYNSSIIVDRVLLLKKGMGPYTGVATILLKG